MSFKASIFDNYQSFLLNINKDKSKKLIYVSGLMRKNKIDIHTYEGIKEITDFIMKKTKKSDEAFIHWFYCWGEHISSRFHSKWALIKYNSTIFPDSYSPILIDKKNEIWLVGSDCEKAYYKYNRLSGINFSTFYKIHAERSLHKQKLKDIEIGISDLIQFNN
jgi:uncharacterized protein YfkK (UPF0435 family)